MASQRYVGGFSRGTVDDEAHWHSARVPGRYKGESGFPLGADSHSVPRQFDQAQMRVRKLIPAPSIVMTGDVGSGKSTAAERMATNAWMMNVRGGQRARLAADITKAGDHRAWIEKLGGEVTDLNAVFRDGVNILDSKLPLTVQDHLRTLSLFVRDISGTKLLPEEKTFLTAGLTAIVEKKQLGAPHITKLNDWLNTVTYDDLAVLWHEMGLLSEGTMPRISQEGIRKITTRLSFRIANIINGDYGQILGGHGSLSEILQRLIVSFDFTYLDPEAQPVVQAYIWQVKAAAARSGDPRFFTDIEIIDENMEYWYSWALAKTLQSRVKKLRATAQLLILVSQHYSDYLAISGKQGKLARNMLHDIGMHMAGPHEDPVNIKHLRKYGKFTRAEAESVMYNDPGSFLAKIGNQPAFVFDSPHTGFIRETSDTDRASYWNLEIAS